MKLPILIIFYLFSINSWSSDLSLAPKSFKLDEKNYTFMDLSQVDYELVYNIKTQTVAVVSTLNFSVNELGRPLFDLKGDIPLATLNNTKVNIIEVKLPENSTSMLSLDQELKPGSYTLVIKHQLKDLVIFENHSVRSAFWMSDLTDRAYLEKYLPTNLEYDHYQMNFKIDIIETNKVHKVMVNCETIENGLNSWTFNCPDYYTASSLFFHLFDENRFQVMTRSYKSANLRIIPITVYGNSSSINSYLNKAQKVMAELENDYGPWPHSQLLIYAAGSGGMEYSGATMSSLSALGHEMHHSYFARGIIPANGNAGWLDEALARWRDNGYKSYFSWQLTKTDMGAHSIYRRSTDRFAYTAGEKFIGHLNKLTEDQGGMIGFLRDLKEQFLYKSMTTAIFNNAFNEYFKLNGDELFNTYILYKEKDGQSSNRWKLESDIINPYHPILTEKDLLNLL